MGAHGCCGGCKIKATACLDSAVIGGDCHALQLRLQTKTISWWKRSRDILVAQLAPSKDSKGFGCTYSPRNCRSVALSGTHPNRSIPAGHGGSGPLLAGDGSVVVTLRITGGGEVTGAAASCAANAECRP